MQAELIGITRYLRGDGTPEELLEHAGRVCYRSQPKGEPGKFLQARIREGHESLIEHLRFIFRITDVPDSELLAAYQVAHGIGLTKGHESIIMSLNARTLRDMVRRSGTRLAYALLEVVADEHPAIFQDLVRSTDRRECGADPDDDLQETRRQKWKSNL